MNAVIATHNLKKRAEIVRILTPLGFNVLNFSLAEVEESGATFEENARLKAESGCRESGFPCVGDDSGLCVDALNGAPGVYSARFAGEPSNDAANIQKLLNLMENIPIQQRSARFFSVICMIFPDGRELAARGSCEGGIAVAPVGSDGFGYDPVFLPMEFPGVTMAQLRTDQKDMISHRGRALRLLSVKREEIGNHY